MFCKCGSELSVFTKRNKELNVYKGHAFCSSCRSEYSAEAETCTEVVDILAAMMFPLKQFDIPSNNIIGERIRSLRRLKNLSQNQLANLSGISLNSISRYERRGVRTIMHIPDGMLDVKTFSTLYFIIIMNADKRAFIII